MENTLDQETIILGDINVKAHSWESPVQDDSGNYWMEWISERNMVVHNKGGRPTFVRGTSEPYIDVTISTDNIAKSIDIWEVLDIKSLTEHRYILFDCQKVGAIKGPKKYRNTINWET